MELWNCFWMAGEVEGFNIPAFCVNAAEDPWTLRLGVEPEWFVGYIAVRYCELWQPSKLLLHNHFRSPYRLMLSSLRDKCRHNEAQYHNGVTFLQLIAGKVYAFYSNGMHGQKLELQDKQFTCYDILWLLDDCGLDLVRFRHPKDLKRFSFLSRSKV